MNFDQIHVKAETESGYLSDNSSINVYISSRADDSTVREINENFQNNKNNLNFNIISAGSPGYFDLDPIVIIEKPGNPLILYSKFNPNKVSEIIKDYLLENNPRSDLALCTLGQEKIENIPCIDDLPFFNIQNRIILRNCGLVAPENINHYILRGGFRGLSEVLKTDQAGAVDRLEKSGLRGRGGAGYFTADKWKSLQEQEGNEKYIICNASDSDPFSFTARILLSGDPYSVLEGMLISAYSTGACKCIITVDSEFKPDTEILASAVDRMKEYGLFGNSIMDSGFNCEIEIIESAVSLPSGEETALLRKLENKQPMPFLRPPYPEKAGLNGKPVIVNNIETFANITAVFQFGPDKISGIGTERSKGTKIITLAENGSAKYIIEIPFGTSLKTVLENYKSIVKDSGNIKAVQFGGPTGAYFLPDADIAVDYDEINKISVIGSGTLEFIFDTECAVETAMNKMIYLHDQSCGKCVFCREGTFQMAAILEDIAKGTGKPQDIDLLKEIADQMKTGCICQLGRTAANPVLSTLQLFRNEYDIHLKEKKCPFNRQ
ncbi:MAG: NADH-quinone oxidoreductase subunit F [Spirochaetes bacterium]|nr:NADH-quinone oxidoreductase subunit F [Spirochaetota bacterium]